MYVVNSITYNPPTFRIRIAYEVEPSVNICCVCHRRTCKYTLLQVDQNMLLHMTPQNPLYALFKKHTHLVAQALFNVVHMPIHQRCLYAHIRFYTSQIYMKEFGDIDYFKDYFKYYIGPYITTYTPENLRTLKQWLEKTQRPLHAWEHRANVPKKSVLPLAKMLCALPLLSPHSNTARQRLGNVLRIIATYLGNGKTPPSCIDQLCHKFHLVDVDKMLPVVFDYAIPPFDCDVIARGLQTLCFPDVRLFNTFDEICVAF